MSTTTSSGRDERSALKTLDRRAEAILRARPAYKEMVDFYLVIFSRQIEWLSRLEVHPETLTAEQAAECLTDETSLAERFDPGIAPDSLLALWGEMKAVFRRGNDVLRHAVQKIDDAENAGGFVPGTWLSEQRPDRGALVADAARLIGIDGPILASLAHAVTYPHWELVARGWLPECRLDEWKRFRCPICGGPPGLVERRAGSASGVEGIKPATRRYMHCSFCGSRWVVLPHKCPACGSSKSGDAKYLFTTDEPEWRIDFCKNCHHYVKAIDGDKVHGRVHAGLELLTAAHLDMLARDKDLTPLEVCA